MKPTALTLTPDQAMLLVADGMDRYQWSFQIAADGSLVNGEPFQRLEMPEEGLFSGVAGLTVDSLGYMWATSAMGIQVCEQPGRCTNILNKPEFTATPVTDIAFGGPDRAWLYVTQGGKIFRRETKRTGVVAWEPVKPPQPGYEIDEFDQNSRRSDRFRSSFAAGRRRSLRTRRKPPGLWPTASTPTPRRPAARRSTTPRAPGAIAPISAAPPARRLRDERFARGFAGKDLKTLFTKIATTMPRGAPGSLGDTVYLDLVAHLLKENGFPAGSRELTADALDGIRVLPGRPKPLPAIGDFSYVEVVGCLSAGARNTWMLTQGSEPVAADGGRVRGARTGGIREAARHADVPAGGCDGLRARRSQGPEGERPRFVDQASRRAAHDDQRVRDGLTELPGVDADAAAGWPASDRRRGGRTRQAAPAEQRYLYVALPGPDDAGADRSVRILVFDIADGHRLVRRIPVWPAAAAATRKWSGAPRPAPGPDGSSSARPAGWRRSI